MTANDADRPPILDGLKVLDLAHQYSGALSAALMADLGAEVVAVEHPERSSIRTMLPKKDGESLWWKVIERGKRVIALDLSTPRGQQIVIDLARQFDVIVENFRPGTLEKWNLGPSDLEEAGVSVIMLRISGFGQTGPDRELPGFGTIAEATSGFAHLNGEPDGPPTFPSTTLADGVAAVFGAMGVLAASWNRATRPEQNGRVEVVDVALFEGLFRLIPTQIPALHQLGTVQTRPGNLLTSHGVLRNLYSSRDGKYFAVSAVGSAAIRRILVGADAENLIAEVDADVMERDPDTVQRFLDACNDAVEAWASVRDYEELARRLQESDAVYRNVYSAQDILEDPQYAARDDLIMVPDSDLGDIMMAGVVPKFPGRTHVVAHAGPPRGAHTEEVLREMLSLDGDEIDKLRMDGVIG
jgi:crotonobetainyl-CoA:carnitine CoA-transferase CaiB-like acyl-CoA transferase